MLVTRGKVHVTALTAVLVLYGCWSVSAAMRGHPWTFTVGGLLALVAAAGIIKSQRWSSYVVYVLALFISAEWLWYMWVICYAGYFSTIAFGQIAISLLPGVAVIAVAGYCSYVAWRYVRDE